MLNIFRGNMIDEEKSNASLNWFLITIDDAPKYLPGKSIFDLLLLLSSVINFKFVITDCIEGFGKDWVVSNFQKKENTIIKFNEVLQFLCDIHQLEWGDFFLFKDLPKQYSNIHNKENSSFIAYSDTTVRAVDNQYMYIYTQNQNIVNAIKSNYVIEKIKAGPLDSLDYPE